MSKKYRDKRGQKQGGSGRVLPMPLLLVLGGFLLIGGALFAVWKSGQPQTPKAPIEVSGAPDLKVDRERVDLGEVPLNQTVSVSFQIANVGSGTLRFSKEPYIEVVEGC